MQALAAFLIGVLSVLLPAIMLWSVWLAGVGFAGPVWIPVTIIPVLGLLVVIGMARG